MILPLCLTLVTLSVSALSQELRIFVIDVDGGGANLIVGPKGDSLLIDAGWPVTSAPRIAEVARKQAGLKKIDYFVATHFHKGHVGGLEELLKLMPIGKFLDHGASVEKGDAADALIASYQRGTGGKHRPVKPGEHIPMAGVSLRVVASGGRFIGSLAGSQKNPHCDGAVLKDNDPTENRQSVGVLVSFGRFRFLNLGDMTWNFEHRMACPLNLLGEVDVLQIPHHGTTLSGAPQHLRALHPQVAFLNNAARTQGTGEVLTTLLTSVAPPEIWQLHPAANATSLNAPEERIVNLGKAGSGDWLKISVRSNGEYSVQNARNGFTRTYRARP